MRIGIAISALLHIFAFVAGYVGWPILRNDHRFDDPQILAVELVTVAEVNRVPAKMAVEKPAPAKPQPKPDLKPEPEPVKVASVPPPDAVPLPDKKPEQKKTPPKPAPKPIAQPQAKPTPPKRFDASKVAALIDKSIKEQSESRQVQEEKLAAAVANAQNVSIDAQRMTATLVAVMRAQVEKCWVPPIGAKGVEDMRVVVRVNLRPDGSLLSAPEVPPDVRQRMARPGEEYYRTLAESAVRAVQRCAPFELPREMYDQWRTANLNFDPQEMVN